MSKTAPSRCASRSPVHFSDRPPCAIEFLPPTPPLCRHLTFLPPRRAVPFARSLTHSFVRSFVLPLLAPHFCPLEPPSPFRLFPLLSHSLPTFRPPSRRSKVLHFVVIPLALNIYRTFPLHAVAATCGRTVREIPLTVDTPPIGPERRLLWDSTIGRPGRCQSLSVVLFIVHSFSLCLSLHAWP